jgi:hypothetical protein
LTIESKALVLAAVVLAHNDDRITVAGARGTNFPFPFLREPYYCIIVELGERVTLSMHNPRGSSWCGHLAIIWYNYLKGGEKKNLDGNLLRGSV